MRVRFLEHYYDEAVIKHSSGRNREIIKKPIEADMPEDLQGKRLITIVNNDETYFTFVFDPEAKEPMAVIQGSYDNPYGKVEANPMMATMLLKKHYTPQDPTASAPHPMKYGGEVRIHPPFKGYKEYPQDASAEFFTDFNNVNAEYTAGDTIADKLKGE